VSDTGPIAITWVGHSTVLIDVAGVRVLTDPLLTMAVAHLRRRHPVPAPPLGPVDVVAVSHVHMDHFHRRSLRKIASDRTTLLIPAGSRALLRDVSFGDVYEVGPGDDVDIERGGGPVRISAVHAEHRSTRGPHTRLTAAALGFVVRAGDRRVYFAGDTGPFDAMADIGPVDVALVPIWGWGATLGERHLDPATAADAVAELDARQVIPIHWGTYSPRRAGRSNPKWLNAPLDHFREALEQRAIGDRLVPLRPGESVTIT
jgi:L-ascorbate metabolism protein UlaG (beta-lactamase superfamily)